MLVNAACAGGSRFERPEDKKDSKSTPKGSHSELVFKLVIVRERQIPEITVHPELEQKTEAGASFL